RGWPSRGSASGRARRGAGIRAAGRRPRPGSAGGWGSHRGAGAAGRAGRGPSRSSSLPDPSAWPSAPHAARRNGPRSRGGACSRRSSTSSPSQRSSRNSTTSRTRGSNLRATSRSGVFRRFLVVMYVKPVPAVERIFTMPRTSFFLTIGGVLSDLLSAGAELGDDRVDAAAVDDAQSLDGDAQAHGPAQRGHEEPLRLDVRGEAPRGAAVGVGDGLPESGDRAGDLTVMGHGRRY